MLSGVPLLDDSGRTGRNVWPRAWVSQRRRCRRI